MRTKSIIIAGAGCTLSDANNKPLRSRPPLDKGFFQDCNRAGHGELRIVKDYLRRTYDFDPTNSNQDRLESVMAIIYADIHNPQLVGDAGEAFRALIRLFNRRIAVTTNDLKPTNRFNLYRILCRMIDNGLSPEEICIITFNQDIQIEKILQKLQSTRRTKRCGIIFSFPFCYKLPNSSGRVTGPRGNIPTFQLGDPSNPGVRILKLHGSLNWYSVHHSKQVPKNAILSSARRFHIIARSELTPGLTYTGKRKQYTFPLVIPPVTHKAGILHDDLQPVWAEAATTLTKAREIVVFGYSCPANDFESANLIRRTVRQNSDLEEFSIIDPDPTIFQRYVDLTGLDRLYYFKTPESYIQS